MGPSHNYYQGRAESSITNWVEYTVTGIVVACKDSLKRIQDAQKESEVDHSATFKHLDPKQRKSLELFKDREIITAKDIQALFGFKPRTVSALCIKWVEDGFLIIKDPSKKGRSYALATKYKTLLS